jgi:predicted phosphodiesterase
MSRIGLIGDVHCQDRYLETALAFLAGRYDRLCCTGDIADGPGDVHRCIALLTEHRVVTVVGNHDEWCLNGFNAKFPDATLRSALSAPEISWMEALPPTIDLGDGLLLCHGIGAHNMKTVKPHDEGYALDANYELHDLIASRAWRLMLCGHSHQRMVRRIGGLAIVNAGSLLHQPGFCLVDSAEGSVRFWEFADSDGQPREVETCRCI